MNSKTNGRTVNSTNLFLRIIQLFPERVKKCKVGNQMKCVGNLVLFLSLSYFKFILCKYTEFVSFTLFITCQYYNINFVL